MLYIPSVILNAVKDLPRDEGRFLHYSWGRSFTAFRMTLGLEHFQLIHGDFESFDPCFTLHRHVYDVKKFGQKKN